MKHISKIVLLGAALALSACANTNRFDNETDVFDEPFDPNAGVVSDPASAEYFQEAVGDRVLFVVDQSSLTAEARATLDAQANWLMTNSDYLAVIEGHADEQGTREYNLALGARRANAVMEYLVSKGVSQSRLKFLSYGKERPAEVCSEESCYSKNRRAVTIISSSLSS